MNEFGTYTGIWGGGEGGCVSDEIRSSCNESEIFYFFLLFSVMLIYGSLRAASVGRLTQP